jgi:anti-sigma regulatory factor (Ser/Thr protein kinase)
MAQKQFEFLNSNATTISVLRQILDYIKTVLPANTEADTLLFKTKVIITELLTNALKHSGSNSTLIDIKVTKKILTITKTDQGNPLSLIDKTNLTRDRITVTSDALHTLHARSTAKDQVQFLFEENNLDNITVIDNIVEHFGLLIITKAADIFVYTYDHHARSNTFIVTLEY